MQAEGSVREAYDVVVVGGGPAGLSAALTLGRARKRVLLCDAGSPRNAAASRIQGFLTRDGTAPQEMRQLGRRELQAYPGVEVRDVQVEEITAVGGAFRVRVGEEVAEAHRILLCTGLIDELPEMEGIRGLWGRSIVQCPYCHGWEARDRRLAALVPEGAHLDFGLLLRGWSEDVVVLTNGGYAVPSDARSRLEAAGVRIEERPIAGLSGAEGVLDHIRFSDGGWLSRDLLFARPPQRQVPLVRSLGVELDPNGYVRVDEMRRETSIPGIYAAGDLLTPGQSAILAAASGMQAGAMLNHELTIASVLQGPL